MKSKNTLLVCFVFLFFLQNNFYGMCIDSLQYDCLHYDLYNRFDPFIYVDFDKSMQIDLYPHAFELTERIVQINGYNLYNFFKTLYKKNNLNNISPVKKIKIPRIIHQIWLGSPIQESFKIYMNSWVEKHCGDEWEYILWTDSDIEKLNLYNKKFYDETDNYGVKSDIARWEILYRYGGVYVDIDQECLRSLDVFHYTYDFYIGLQPLDSFFVQVGIGLVGSIPKHPILKHCIETISDDWYKKGAPKKTGPVHCTRSFYYTADQLGMVDIALPAIYFYPLGCCQQFEKLDKQKWVQEGAFAIHWWAKSWMPKKYRPYRFRDIANKTSVQNWNK